MASMSEHRENWIARANTIPKGDNLEWASKRSHLHAIFRGDVDDEDSDYNGANATFCNNEPCYGRIANIGYEIDEYGSGAPGISELSIAIMKQSCNKEYAQYVMSLYDRAFITKTVDEGLEIGFDLDVSLPYEYLLSAMIAMRKASILSDMSFWEDLIKHGASEDEAFYLIDSFTASERTIYNWNNYRPDHCVLSAGTNFQDFLRGKDHLVNPASPSAYDSVVKQEGEVWDLWPQSENGYPVGRELAVSNRMFAGVALPYNEDSFRLLLNLIRKGM